MSQKKLLIQALKQLLKSQGMTYKDVAQKLNLSEASIKRMFANHQLTLDRIEEVCNLLGIEISDLLQKMQQLSQRVTQLTFDQETKIVSDHKLFLVTICVINYWTFEQILNYYDLSEAECIQCLAELDKIKLIELLPKNKIKLLISSSFSWLPNGPIQKFFQQYILHDFIESNFQNDDEKMILQFGMLSKESNILLQKKLQRLAEEFLHLKDQDTSQPFNKKAGTACILMLRPWAPGIFKKYIKT